MIICSQPECQTTAGCTCTNRLFDYNRLRGELSALKKQVEELTAERNDARRYAVEARLRENQAEDRRVSESFARAKAEAEAAALREERDRLNGCLNLANERTDENFDQAVKSAFIAAKLRRENEALRKALEFYADVSKYPAPLTGGMGDLWADCGQIARAALNQRGADLPV